MDTNVLIDFRQQDGKTPEVPVTEGYLLWTPLRREIYDTYVTVPEPFAVYLTNGVGTAVIKNSWPYWRVTERGIPSGITRTVQVPSVSEIHYSSLTDVDPATLEPSAEPEAAWWAIVESLPLPAFRPDPDDEGALIVDLWSWQLASDDQNALLVTVEEN